MSDCSEPRERASTKPTLSFREPSRGPVTKETVEQSHAHCVKCVEIRLPKRRSMRFLRHKDAIARVPHVDARQVKDHPRQSRAAVIDRHDVMSLATWDADPMLQELLPKAILLTRSRQ